MNRLPPRTTTVGPAPKRVEEDRKELFQDLFDIEKKDDVAERIVLTGRMFC